MFLLRHAHSGEVGGDVGIGEFRWFISIKLKAESLKVALKTECDPL
jgi:hypothetical protein